MALTIGTLLGSHEITALLGKGGMGEVYRARDTKLKRDVAIKILPDEFSRDRDRVARFQREAEVLAALNHPNIASIYDVQEANETRFLVLELVEGETLAQRIQRGPIPVEEALEIAKAISEALEAAHEKGIVHRDLKPANIKIAADGRVKVLDFGLAKALQTGPQTSTLSNSPTLSLGATQAGMILGTAAYMSPEQAKGFEADARSDIFSFGAVFYEMLTARQAFQGDTAAEVLASVLVRDADFAPLPPNLNPRLHELLQRCLHKSPKRRWHAAGDLRAELEIITSSAAVSAPVVPAPPQLSWRRRAIPLIVTAVLFSALAGITAWIFKPSVPQPVAKFSVVLPDDQTFTRTRSQVVAISPDGTTLVYVANRQLYLRRLDDMEARPIPGTQQDVGSPFFSPDGRWLAFFSFQDDAIKKIALTGGAAVTLCTGCTTTLARGMSWEGHTIVFAQSGASIVSIADTGSKPEPWVKSESNEILSSPQLLPGGDALMFTVNSPGAADSAEKADIVLVSKKMPQRQVLIHGGSGARYAPTGHIVYRVGANLYAVPFDLQHLKTTGEPIPVVENVMKTSADYGPPNYGFSSNGALVYVPTSSGMAGEARRNLMVVDRNGKGSAVPGLPAGSYATPRVSPDGNQVTFEVVDDGSISVYDLSGKSQIRRLTLDSGRNSYPVWSPDGKRIAYRSTGEAKPGIFVQNADGTGSAERLTTSPTAEDATFSWHPDGMLAFLRQRALWTVSVASDRKIVRLSEASDGSQYNAAFSPDGRWLAYVSGGSRQPGSHIFIQQFPNGARYQVSREPSDGPCWSRDGKELFYNQLDTGKLVSIKVQTQPAFSVGEPTPLPIERIQQGTNLRQYDVLPDGRFLVLRDASDSNRSAPHTTQQIHVVLNWFTELKQRVAVK